MKDHVSEANTVNEPRPRGRSARRAKRQSETASKAVWPGIPGGAYRPLGDHDIERIHHTALDVLENVGMGEPIPVLVEHALAKGCRINDRGRLCFPRSLVEDIIDQAPSTAIHHAQDSNLDIELSGTKVHFDPGGEAVRTVELDTGRYRPSTLVDLYDFARLTDRLPHMDSFGKIVVPTDIDDPFEHDIGALYACVSGTVKHVGMGFSDAAHLDSALEMFDIIAGGEGRFVKRPFCSSGGCPIVSPLTYGKENSEVCLAATKFKAPVSVIIAPQAGATSPAALAGTLVQTTAETLAGLLLVDLVHPGHPVVFGPWPFVSDLRTGSFSGGGGEQAVLAAAAVQIANFYDLPCGTGAGMSDSKVPDNQAGYEKGISTTLAALAGGNYISEVCGMTASLIGGSFEAMVIDNEMVGTIQRVLRGIEVTDDTLSYEVIRDVVDGPGHFLGHPQTLEMMETEYLYPTLADRRPPDEWEEDGSPDIRHRARERVREILSTHYPAHIDSKTDARIRERFPIRLPREAMRAESGRW